MAALLNLGASFGNRWGDYGFPLLCCGFTDTFDFLEGVIWLAIATAVEVPQAVRSGYRCRTYPFRSSPFYTVGAPDFESEW